jgi:excisionase family DNA binding protein
MAHRATATCEQAETTLQEPPIPNAAVRIDELARRLSISRRHAVKLVAEGKIRSTRAGYCVLISEAAIAEFLR